MKIYNIDFDKSLSLEEQVAAHEGIQRHGKFLSWLPGLWWTPDKGQLEPEKWIIERLRFVIIEEKEVKDEG